MNTRETDFWNEKSAARLSPSKFGEIVATAADLAIVLNMSGVVQSLIVNPLNPSLGRLDHWERRNIRDFLAPDSKDKVDRVLKSFADGDAGNLESIEVNHFDNANWEFPIRYTMHRTGDQDIVLMLGRDLRPVAELQMRLVKAQLALEKDYEAHREFETRYRVLMDATRDPFVLVSAITGKIIDVNSAAGLALGAEVEALIGASFAAEFQGQKQSDLLEAIRNDIETGGLGIPVEARRTARSLKLTGRTFRAAGERVLLCRLEGIDDDVTGTDDLSVILSTLYRDGADAIITTDKHGTIRYANDAFLTLADIGGLSDLRGRNLSDYLSRGSVDVKVLCDNATRNGTMPVYSTRLQSSFGSQIAIEVSATHLTSGGKSGFAFVMRDASRMELIRESSGPEIPGALGEAHNQNVMDLVGSAPLKDIVAATTDVVEKICIETAVELTRNNRVAAAEMLGLSRQSLYVKLRKYGLLSKND